MNTSQENEDGHADQADTKTESSEQGTKQESPEPSGPHGQRAPRVFIRQSIVRQLVESGISNDITSVTKAVNEILDYAITSRQAEMVNMNDILAIEQGLADRIEELTAVNIAMAKLLCDLDTVIERDRIFGSFTAIVKSRTPAKAISTEPQTAS
jgi:hypothetical protein